MFNLFKNGSRKATEPQLTDQQIKERAKAMAERMGPKFCAAKDSTFVFVPGKSVVLGGEPKLC